MNELTFSEYMKFNKPPKGFPNWDAFLNENFDILDGKLKAIDAQNNDLAKEMENSKNKFAKIVYDSIITSVGQSTTSALLAEINAIRGFDVRFACILKIFLASGDRGFYAMYSIFKPQSQTVGIQTIYTTTSSDSYLPKIQVIYEPTTGTIQIFMVGSSQNSGATRMFAWIEGMGYPTEEQAARFIGR